MCGLVKVSVLATGVGKQYHSDGNGDGRIITSRVSGSGNRVVITGRSIIVSNPLWGKVSPKKITIMDITMQFLRDQNKDTEA